MKVPFQLKPRDDKSHASALLLTSHDTGELLALLRRLGLDPLPAVHAVADGFLVVLPKATEANFGVVGLRELAKHLWLPTDAELVPSLLPEEAAALASRRGLVFLPGGRVLEYARDEPLALSSLLRVAMKPRGEWSALPEPPSLADDVVEIALVLPPQSPDEILVLPPTSSEEPSLPDNDAPPSLPTKLIAGALFGMGKGIAKVGKMLKLPGVAGVGAKLLGGAMSMLPDLAAKLMGDQEAALRRLLREFREGDAEKALKHALPLGGENDGTPPQASNARLPTHNLFFSLQQLFAGASAPAGGGWFSSNNTYYELMAEYRKRAEKATREGDFRRAAFIYAKLLRDFRAAALVLSQGGLHREAAQVYEKLAGDWPAAAREWEAAGEVDRALQLYRQFNSHVLAGDLLRRIGEEEQAVAEYQVAAHKLAENGYGHYDAGELLRTRANRPDLALDYFIAGWKARQSGNSVSCAIRLAEHHAEREDSKPLLELLDEAAPFFANRSSEEGAGLFYNRVAVLAGQHPQPATADELRDRALIGLATQLRSHRQQQSQPTNLPSVLFPSESAWPAPLLRDVQFAAFHAVVERLVPAKFHEVTNLNDTVTAVCHASRTGEIYFGTDDGKVYCYRPRSGETFVIAKEAGPILDIAVSDTNHVVAVLSRMESSGVKLATYQSNHGYRNAKVASIGNGETAYFSRQANNCAVCFCFVVVTDREAVVYDEDTLSRVVSSVYSADDTPHAALHSRSHEKSVHLLFFLGGRDLRLVELGPLDGSCRHNDAMQDWDFCHPFGAPRPLVPLHAVENAKGTMTCVGFDEHGEVCVAELNSLWNSNEVSPTVRIKPMETCQTIAVIGRVRLALIRPARVEFWTLAGKHQTTIAQPVDDAVAAFHLPTTNELLIVGGAGRIVRVAAPG